MTTSQRDPGRCHFDTHDQHAPVVLAVMSAHVAGICLDACARKPSNMEDLNLGTFVAGNPASPGLVFLIPFIAATTLLGLALGEAFRRPDSSSVALILTSVPALFLSGISFPWENQAAWVRAVSLLLPSTFGIPGFVQIGEMRATLAEVWRPWGALWLQTLLFGLTAAYLMVRRRSADGLHVR